MWVYPHAALNYSKIFHHRLSFQTVTEKYGTKDDALSFTAGEESIESSQTSSSTMILQHKMDFNEEILARTGIVLT